MEQQTRLNFLIARLASQSASDSELTELTELLQQDTSDKVIVHIEEQLAMVSPATQPPFDREKWMAVADKILAADKINPPTERLREKPRISLMRMKHWVAAAVLLAIMVLLTIWFVPRKAVMPSDADHASKPVPGKDGALLTLADGSTIVLDSSGNGLIAQQAGTNILLDSGRLSYEVAGTGGAVFNTLSTPNGRQFHIQLPDGTVVWLNAASSITYPTSFSGDERLVRLSGEAYFEVAQNPAIPFRVLIEGEAEVKVLGTRFNLNAYKDDGSINAMLLEGAVEVTSLGTQSQKGPGAVNQTVQLKPGQLARLNGNVQVVNGADVEKIMAWKNGLFNFEGCSLTGVMNQLERWYDIQVVYPPVIPSITFIGELNRSTPFEGAARALERSGVHFRMDGRKLIIMSEPVQ